MGWAERRPWRGWRARGGGWTTRARTARPRARAGGAGRGCTSREARTTAGRWTPWSGACRDPRPARSPSRGSRSARRASPAHNGVCAQLRSPQGHVPAVLPPPAAPPPRRRRVAALTRTRVGAPQAAGHAGRSAFLRRHRARAPAPPPLPSPPTAPLPRTNRTSLVPPLVLSGHAASLTPFRPPPPRPQL